MARPRLETPVGMWKGQVQRVTGEAKHGVEVSVGTQRPPSQDGAWATFEVEGKHRPRTNKYPGFPVGRREPSAELMPPGSLPLQSAS